MRVKWTLLLLLAISCRTGVDPGDDRVEALRAGLEYVDPSHHAHIVAGADLLPVAKAAAERGQIVIPEARVLQDSQYTLPRGYIIVQRVRVVANTAQVALLVGPVPKPQPGQLLLDCGTRHEFELERAGGAWKVVRTKVAVC